MNGTVTAREDSAIEEKAEERVHEREAADRKKLGHTRALGFLAVAAFAALVWLALPVGVGLFLGVLLAFTLQPIYGRLRARRWRAGVSALVCSLGATMLVAGVVVGFAVLSITRGVALVSSLPALLAPGGALREFVTSSTARLSPVHVNAAALWSKLEEGAMSLGSRMAGFAADGAGFALGGLLTMFFMTLATYFALLHWKELVHRAELILPFEPRHTRALLDQFRTIGRQVLRGTVVTGFVQGVLAGIGYWLTGAPEPVFFGALTAVASLVPGVGTALVWVPIGIYRTLTGHVGAGVAELIYGALVVGILSDYVIRPRLVGRDEGIPAIFTFVSIFGGVQVFGLIGLVVGPIIVTLSVAVLRTYQAEVALARASRP